jgi:hypothetical protein
MNDVPRCDVCGRFISTADLARGAVHRLIYPDSYRTGEKWETLCLRHAKPFDFYDKPEVLMRLI